MASQKQTGKGTKKYGRNEKKCAAYKARHTREKNKLKKILQSNGVEAAEEYKKGI